MSRLILIPTAAESRLLKPLLHRGGDASQERIELCGFGPIAAAARAAQLIAALEPPEVLLVGIAGSLGSGSAEAAPAIGTACRFESVACYGIGAGTGRDHQSAAEMGWAHWQGPAPEQRIAESLPLATAEGEQPPAAGQLLTCCSASVGPGDVRLRTDAFPAAVAEDMEGFGVAVSCHLAGVPLNIVRGISNQAGDRQHDRWDVEAALHAAAQLALKTLSRS